MFYVKNVSLSEVGTNQVGSVTCDPVVAGIRRGRCGGGLRRLSGSQCLAGVPLACSQITCSQVATSLSSDQPDDEFPASEQSLAGLTDDDFLHLLALFPVLHWGPVHPGHHHLEVGDGGLRVRF